MGNFLRQYTEFDLMIGWVALTLVLIGSAVWAVKTKPEKDVLMKVFGNLGAAWLMLTMCILYMKGILS